MDTFRWEGKHIPTLACVNYDHHYSYRKQLNLLFDNPELFVDNRVRSVPDVESMNSLVKESTMIMKALRSS